MRDRAILIVAFKLLRGNGVGALRIWVFREEKFIVGAVLELDLREAETWSEISLINKMQLWIKRFDKTCKCLSLHRLEWFSSSPYRSSSFGLNRSAWESSLSAHSHCNLLGPICRFSSSCRRSSPIFSPYKERSLIFNYFYVNKFVTIFSYLINSRPDASSHLSPAA